MLKLKNVSKYYYQDGMIASGFTKVNLDLNLGEFVVITGESGSGKSTLLNVLSGLDTYEDGEMYINGEETSHYTEEDYLNYRRSYVSNIFQNFNLVNSYTVYENIELTMLMNGKNKSEIKPIIEDLINKVGLKKYRHTLVSKLSGGQKQRVAIARALANDTPIIVCDEPTGALDSKASSEILKLLYEVSKDKLVIVVTHNKAEIEKYATRLIRMHDGKILENKVIKKIDLDDQIKSRDVNNITWINKVILGVRNAFNIPIKFLLMFAIYLLITVTLISNYGSLKIAEYEEINYSYSSYFMDDTDKRIIINKKDKSPITESEYQSIAKLSNIEYLVKNDLYNDYSVYMQNGHVYLDGYLRKDKVTNVDYGRNINGDNEIIVIGNPDSYYLKEEKEEVLKGTYAFSDENVSFRGKVVGIVYDSSLSEYTYEFVFSDNLMQLINYSTNINANKLKININKNYLNVYDNRIGISNKVPEGEIYLKDTLNSYCSNYNCMNNIVNLNASNIYHNDNLALKVSKVVGENNSKDLVDGQVDNSYISLYINEKDYNKLFNDASYQSSVYVKEVKDVELACKDLNDLGFNTLALRESKRNDAEMIMNIFKIFRLIVIGALVITLFFISYFIMKIIYKSRNSYYTTLRTLGSTKKVCVNILMNELITLATFTYTLFVIFAILVKNNIIKFAYLTKMTKYIGIKEYLFVYLILILLSLLMALRYGRKIFKNSIIKTYGERL